ncbi:MAG: hypothetical protein PUB87_07880 [Eubacteriaceae bacterium]|nr:hypothetical protein [Eubacteriaceae bacterium]
MKSINYVLSFFMVIFLSAAIMILSSNIVLRISSMYVYHFNDSQAVLNIPYNVNGSEMADGISGYLSSFSKDEFQVYEDNRIYKDPLFNKNEQAVMKKAKQTLAIELGIGIFSLAGALGTYLYLLKNGFTEALRNRGKLTVGITAFLIILRVILCSSKGFRTWLYSFCIGIKLKKDSLLVMVLGDPLYKTYLLFATVLAVALLGIYAYVTYVTAKEKRIFY